MDAVLWCLFALWYICGVVWDIFAVTERRAYRIIDVWATLLLAITGPLWPLWVYYKFGFKRVHPNLNPSTVLFNKR